MNLLHKLMAWADASPAGMAVLIGVEGLCCLLVLWLVLREMGAPK